MFETINRLAQSTNGSYINILIANLTTDEINVLKTTNLSGYEIAPNVKKLSAFLNDLVMLGLIHKDDIFDFRQNMTKENLSEFLERNRDKRNFFSMYRVYNGTRYEWCAFEAFAAEDYTSINKTFYLIIKRIDNYNLESITGAYKALCDNFDSIYSYNLKTGKIIGYRFITNGFDTFENYIKSEPNYTELIEKYVSTTVYTSDKDYVRKMASTEMVRSHLKESKTYTFEYRTYVNNKLSWYMMKYAKIGTDEESDNLIIGVSDITNIKNLEKDFYRDGNVIVIVNDDREETDYLSNLFINDYKIIASDNGDDAIRLIKSLRYDISMIIASTDMTIDGCDFISFVSKSGEYDSIPVIAILDRNDKISVQNALESGAADIIGKPFAPDLIKKRVQLVIKYRSASNLLSLIEYDLVTGIYSREFFYRHCEQIMQKNYDKKYAIIVFGIEELRVYNDRNGVEAGNNLLKLFTSFLEKKYYDAYCLGKIRHHLFAVLVSDELYKDFSYEGIAKTIDLGNIPDFPKNVIVKSGIYICDEKTSASNMCDRAELAMERVFGVYGESIGIYDEEFKNGIVKRRMMIDNSDSALKDKQFKVYYQPKHLTKTGKIGGAEALVRWIHPSFGFMNPGEFIEVFEQSGFIKKIDKYVLIKVCEDLTEWYKKDLPLVPVSINLSRRDFDNEDLVEQIVEIVDGYRIDHSLIHFEITESAYSDNPIKIEKDVKKLHGLGFNIELDDFGTGYSSLSSIVKLDIDFIKFDRSLLLSDDPTSKKNIMYSFAHFAKRAGIKIVQEGVETPSQLKRVKQLGCDYIQGYYYSKPLPKVEFDAYLKNQL